jgi:hypothetical protein
LFCWGQELGIHFLHFPLIPLWNSTCLLLVNRNLKWNIIDGIDMILTADMVNTTLHKLITLIIFLLLWILVQKWTKSSLSGQLLTFL